MIALTSWYNSNARSIFDRYEEISSEKIYDCINEYIPKEINSALDIGSGSGRDASWIAQRSNSVTAIEPSNEMRSLARNKHTSKKIKWIEDSLPDLANVSQHRSKFDFILLNAVWAHIPKSDRSKAFYQMARLLVENGILVISFRIDGGRLREDIHPVSLHEIEELADAYGLDRLKVVLPTSDPHQRKDVAWVTIVLRAPENPIIGMPMINNILYDENHNDKNGTHKFAMLRTFCHMNQFLDFVSSTNNNEGLASFPTGLVCLIWIKLYLPLFRNNIPQRLQNIGYKKVKFANESFIKLAENQRLTLKIGQTYYNGDAYCISSALQCTRNALRTGPIEHSTGSSKKIKIIKFISSEKRFSVKSEREITLNKDYFYKFGTIQICWRTWQSIQTFRPLVENEINELWFKLIKSYFFKQVGRGLRRENEIPSDELIRMQLNWYE